MSRATRRWRSRHSVMRARSGGGQWQARQTVAARAAGTWERLNRLRRRGALQNAATLGLVVLGPVLALRDLPRPRAAGPGRLSPFAAAGPAGRPRLCAGRRRAGAAARRRDGRRAARAVGRIAAAPAADRRLRADRADPDGAGRGLRRADGQHRAGRLVLRPGAEGGGRLAGRGGGLRGRAPPRPDHRRRGAGRLPERRAAAGLLHARTATCGSCWPRGRARSSAACARPTSSTAPARSGRAATGPTCSTTSSPGRGRSPRAAKRRDRGDRGLGQQRVPRPGRAARPSRPLPLCHAATWTARS